MVDWADMELKMIWPEGERAAEIEAAESGGVLWNTGVQTEAI